MSAINEFTAARRALEAHDRLCESNAREPRCDENGLPYEPTAWINWHDNDYKPAHSRWVVAMDVLANALDDPGMSRHPANFRPRCEELLSC